MLVLLFEIGDERFALDTGVIVKVIPKIRCKKISLFPEYVAGIINYHGNPVPVIDLNSFHSAVPCKARLSTRIIIVNHVRKYFNNVHVGLIAERVTETAKVDDRYINERSPLTDLVLGKGEQEKDNAVVQWYDLDHLLSEDLLNEIIQE